MSSVSFNVGFSNERNSSRVLKPPGGGHTDIFGIGEVQEPKKPQKINDEPAAVEAEIKTETEQKSTEEESQQKPPEEEVVVNKTEENNENKIVKEEPKQEPPRRVRVPPGGFSSGLW